MKNWAAVDGYLADWREATVEDDDAVIDLLKTNMNDSESDSDTIDPLNAANV